MGTRSNDLTEVSKILAEKLRLRIGSLKLVLSASVVALSKLSAEERENMVAEAQGIAGEKVPEKATATKPVPPSVLEAVDAVKYATVHYKLHSKKEQEAPDELRWILGPEPKSKKRMAKGG